MATLLGTPYKRGKSDIINAYDRPETFIEEGVAVVETSNTTIAKFDGSNGVICGVMGHTEHKGASVIKAGQEVAVQLSSEVTAIDPKLERVYVTADGLFTNDEGAEGSENTPVNAIWVDTGDGEYCVMENGIVSGSSKRSNQKCAFISFVGGL